MSRGIRARRTPRPGRPESPRVPDRPACRWTGPPRRAGAARPFRLAVRSGPRCTREAGRRGWRGSFLRGLRRKCRYHRVVLAGLAGLRSPAGGAKVSEEVHVDLVVLLPLLRHVVFVVDRLDRADRLARAGAASEGVLDQPDDLGALAADLTG